MKRNQENLHLVTASFLKFVINISIYPYFTSNLIQNNFKYELQVDTHCHNANMYNTKNKGKPRTKPKRYSKDVTT